MPFFFKLPLNICIKEFFIRDNTGSVVLSKALKIQRLFIVTDNHPNAAPSYIITGLKLDHFTISVPGAGKGAVCVEDQLLDQVFRIVKLTCEVIV